MLMLSSNVELGDRAKDEIVYAGVYERSSRGRGLVTVYRVLYIRKA